MRQTLRSFFLPPLTGDQPAGGRARLVWIVRLRWVAIAAQILTIVPAIEYEILEQRLVPAYVGVIGLLATVNAVSWLGLRRDFEVRQGHLLIQLGIDITTLSLLLVMTGGAWNPLLPILFVHTGLGALLLHGRTSLAFIILLMVCLGGIQLSSYVPPGLRPPQPPAEILFPAQFVVALGFWILTSWLSNTLTELQRDYAWLSEQHFRVDRLRAVGALAAGLSHEFATPLNTAQLKLERIARTRELGDDPDIETAREALNRCREVLRNMAGSQLRPEGLVLEAVEVRHFVEQVCRSAQQDCPDNKIVFSSDGRSPLHALLPDIAFSQAILNLIDNAVESGGPGNEVHIRVEGGSEHIDVSVMDSGYGWPEEVRRRLGEPFITTKPEGVGLGLYFVHTLAGAVGAELHLEDREDLEGRERSGAIARISLPLLPPAERSA